MFPDTNQPQPTPAPSLPPVSTQPPATPPLMSVPQSPAPLSPVGTSPAQVLMRAEQLVGQYQYDPFRLSMALSQLKADYLAEHFNIRPNAAEN